MSEHGWFDRLTTGLTDKTDVSAGGLGRVGARPRRAASLRGELEALRRDSGAGPEAGNDERERIEVQISLVKVL